MKYNLEDVKSLLKESEDCEFDLLHEQVSDLLDWVSKREEYYLRLQSLIMFYLSKDYGLSTSTMIGPFAKALARVMGDEVFKDCVGIEKQSQLDPLPKPTVPPNRKMREGSILKETRESE